MRQRIVSGDLSHLTEEEVVNVLRHNDPDQSRQMVKHWEDVGRQQKRHAKNLVPDEVMQQSPKNVAKYIHEIIRVSLGEGRVRRPDQGASSASAAAASSTDVPSSSSAVGTGEIPARQSASDAFASSSTGQALAERLDERAEEL